MRRTTSAEGTTSSMRQPFELPTSMYSMKRAMWPLPRQRSAIGRMSPSLTPRFTTMLTFTGERPVAAHQRLAPGQADLLHAETDEDARQPRDLLEAEDGAVRQERVIGVEHLARHAVHAAEVAAVGDRDAQVVHRAPERVT